ncbi:iron transporter [Gardnerella sp. 2492-Sm]|uniref:iron transporter n=1 Tax=unclassified Gardnerella TaxID=2628112 RepID=UPI003D029306
MKNKKIISIAALVLAGVLAFAGCGTNGSNSGSSKKPQASEQKADDNGGDKGFEEIQVGPHQDQNIGPLMIGAVYFQPVDMVPAGMGLKASEASFHLEADIHANQEGTKLGYGKGEFIPDLTVNYEIIDKASGASAGKGTFMQMNASDGPHYGANVKLDKAGSYKLVLSIESPEKRGWMLHVDPATGVTGRFWTEPIKATFDDWKYTPRQW